MFFIFKLEALLVVAVSTFEFRFTISKVSQRFILQREACLVYDMPFFKSSFKGTGARVSETALLVHSLGFSMGLVQGCFIVYDNVANIRHAALAQLY